MCLLNMIVIFFPHLWEWNCWLARQTWCWWDYLLLDAWCSHPHRSSPPMQSSNSAWLASNLIKYNCLIIVCFYVFWRTSTVVHFRYFLAHFRHFRTTSVTSALVTYSWGLTVLWSWVPSHLGLKLASLDLHLDVNMPWNKLILKFECTFSNIFTAPL